MFTLTDTQLRSKTENTWPFLESHDYNPQIKVCVKSILNVCSEFVTPQKNVLLTTQPNLNAKKNRQVNKIRYQNLEKK